MSKDADEYSSGADRAIWHEFERRRESLPESSEDPDARRDRIHSAYVEQGGWGRASALNATEYAELASRLRFGLGPSVSQETFDAVARIEIEEAADLLRAGVSPELLGLVGGGQTSG